MPVLVIGLTCFVIFLITMGIGLAAVHFERKQQVREESEGKHLDEAKVEAKAV